MKPIALLLTLLFLCFSLAGCGSDEGYWVATSKVCDEFLGHLVAGRYADAHSLFDPASPVYGKPETRDDFVAAMKLQSELWPGLMQFKWKLDRLEGSSRTRLYRFKATLDWPGGYPAGEETAIRSKDGRDMLPTLGREMSIGVIQRHGRWGIQAVTLFSEPRDLFGGGGAGE